MGVPVAAGVVVAVLVANWLCRSRPPSSARPPRIDVVSRPVPRIRPGTVIGDRAPEGWTHLVVKSKPRIGDDQLAEVPSTMAHVASLLFTVVLARVQQVDADGPRFQLAEVAVGVGATVDGQDVVLSSATQKALGADFGFVDRAVLSGSEAQQERGRCVARSPTMALLDAPTFLLHDGEHHAVVVRYAVLVDGATGRLDTLVWALRQPRDRHAVPLGPAEWLAPNMVEDCILHVDADRFILGIPLTKKAVAMSRLPKGTRTVEPPEGLQRLAATVPPFTVEGARRLERQLRGLLSRYGDAGARY